MLRLVDEIVMRSMDIDMMHPAQKRFSLHKTASTVVVVLYLSVIPAVDLFHDDECQGIPTDAGRSVPAADGNECPACKLRAGHHTTPVDFTPTQINVECLSASQFLHHVTVLHRCEWRHSVTSRAPPSITTS
jgi:hypothetical protein